jgi:hypothetical protein
MDQSHHPHPPPPPKPKPKPSYLDGRFDLEAELPGLAPDKGVQLWQILQLCVAVEKKRGVVGSRKGLCVERFEVQGEVVDPLGVEEFPDHVGGLKFADSAKVLADGAVVITFAVKMVTVLAENVNDQT